MKAVRGGGSEEGGRVLWDATSRGLCGRVGPPRTNVRAAKSKEDGEEERGARGIVRESCPKPKPNPREPNPKPTPQTRIKLRRCRWKRHGLDRCALIRKPV